MVLSISIVVSISVFADTGHLNIQLKDAGVESASISSISYISQSDATLLANECIENQISIGTHCTWDSTTAVKEIVKLFDFDNNVNAYLFRLSTGGKQTGYIIVNASVESPSVDAFGYDCDYMLDSISLNGSGKKVSTNDHVIWINAFTYLKYNESDQKYIDFSTNKPIDATKQQLKNSYQEQIAEDIDTNDKANLQLLKNNTVTPNQIVYTEHALSGIWSSGYPIYVTGDFHGYPDDCAPTAGTNLAYYWAHYGSPLKSNLWTGAYS